MRPQPPVATGTPASALNTPALVVDLDAFERNLKKMADDVASFGVRFRPHAKTHKCPDIALQQIALGAIGCCCQTLHEAEALVDGGVANVLVSNQVVGGNKIERLAQLATRASIGVCVDDAENIRALDRAAFDAGSRVNVLVEVDIGMGRCGVAPGQPAMELALRVNDSPNLHFEGVQAYHGQAQHIRKYSDREQAVQHATDLTEQTVDLLKTNGLSCETIAGAGTGTYRFEASGGLYNELQAGSYIFMDADYARNKSQDGSGFSEFENSLFVLSTVISMPAKERVVVDAGLKAHSIDSGLPIVADFDDIVYAGPSDEHGSLDLSGSRQSFSIGDKVRLVPGHCDPTVNLYDWFIGVRNSEVEVCWPITARGPGF